MITLDVTVFPLGRFFVHDDYGIEEVLLLPSTGDEEIKWLEEVMKRIAVPYGEPRQTLLNALARTYRLDETDCDFHLVAPFEPVIDMVNGQEPGPVGP